VETPNKEYDLYIEAELATLEVFFGAELNEYKHEVYVEELRHLTPEQINEAVSRLKRTWKPTGPNPYPAICDILEAAGATEADEEREMLAVLRLAIDRSNCYNNVTFNDLALHHTIRAFGGLSFFREADDRWWDFNEERFLEMYRTAKKNGLRGPKCLPGIHGHELETWDVRTQKQKVLGHERGHELEDKSAAFFDDIAAGMKSI
jgi:hypothetical protein